MKAVVQRVREASVSVENREVGHIERGYVALVGFNGDEDELVLQWMARKIATLRVFEDENGRMNLPLEAVDGKILIVSQFTLYGDVTRGARPSFDQSAPAETARRLYERFVELVEAEVPGRVATGEFQAMMSVSLVNDGPVTLIIEKE